MRPGHMTSLSEPQDPRFGPAEVHPRNDHSASRRPRPPSQRATSPKGLGISGGGVFTGLFCLFAPAYLGAPADSGWRAVWYVTGILAGIVGLRYALGELARLQEREKAADYWGISLALAMIVAVLFFAERAGRIGTEASTFTKFIVLLMLFISSGVFYAGVSFYLRSENGNSTDPASPSPEQDLHQQYEEEPPAMGATQWLIWLSGIIIFFNFIVGWRST
jgi:hypothetical protein